MLTFNKDLQPKIALHPERAYLGTAPSLNAIRLTYSNEVLIVWIMAQLEDVNDFVAIRDKMNIRQMEQIANIIATEYSFLKVSELHLFFYRFKAGQYGLFYGNIDPLKITQALIQFIEQRRNDIARIEHKLRQEKLQNQHQEWAKTAISREEYELLKQSKLGN